MGVTEQGLAAIVKTRGNKDVHVILRGGTSGPNYATEFVQDAARNILKKREWASIMVDCSRQFFLHYRLPLMLTPRSSNFLAPDGNSRKNHNNQPLVVDDICVQLANGERHITGVMIESHINEGRQDVPDEGPQGLKWGVSITDACVDWQRTVVMLDKLNEVRTFRKHLVCLRLIGFSHHVQAVGKRRNRLMEAGLSRPAAFKSAHQ